MTKNLLLHRVQVLAASIMLVALSACSTMSEKECLSADWYKIGYEDGKTGQQADRLERIAQDCGKVKVVPDQSQYLSGRIDGLRQYCTPENGFSLGKAGHSFNNVCSLQSVSAFEASYYAGKRIHEARERVEQLESERSRLKNALSKAKIEEERKHLDKELDENEEHLDTAKDALFHVEVAEHPVSR